LSINKNSWFVNIKIRIEYLYRAFSGNPGYQNRRGGGIPDIIIHKETGLLVPPDNSEQLAEAILQTLENPDAAKHRAEKAFRYVCNNHTIDMMGERILGLYERLLS